MNELIDVIKDKNIETADSDGIKHGTINIWWHSPALETIIFIKQMLTKQ